MSDELNDDLVCEECGVKFQTRAQKNGHKAHHSDGHNLSEKLDEIDPGDLSEIPPVSEEDGK